MKPSPVHKSIRLLLVEDELILALPIVRGLEEEGYVVDLAKDGLEGENLALNQSYDAMLIDWGLPLLDGRTLIQRLRRQGCDVPIIMLTARRDVEHRVAGLDAGADDYLSKPYSYEELLARLRALLRRSVPPSVQLSRSTLGGLRLDATRNQAFIGKTSLLLRTKEYKLLELLLEQRDSVLTRTLIAQRIWGSILEVTDNAIDVTVSGLRNKLSETVSESNMLEIETIRGVGYILKEVEQVSISPDEKE